MEHLEVVCENTGRPLGIYLPRHEALAQGAWCRSTNVFVLKKTGEVLCHQRSLQKERMPGVWSTHLGGHVSKDETFETNAMKELLEESGIARAPHQVIPWRTTRLTKARLWVREFVTVYEDEMDVLVPQVGEVDQFIWKSPQEIMTESNNSPDMWCVGTHDFEVEYQCMMAVLTAGHALGYVNKPVASTHSLIST